jgi:hypothetical protein
MNRGERKDSERVRMTRKDLSIVFTTLEHTHLLDAMCVCSNGVGARCP